MKRIIFIVVIVISTLFLASCSKQKKLSEKDKSEQIFKDKYIGKNVFSVVGRGISSAKPETLKGTNNKHWFVYYKNIDATFIVEKKTDIILNAAQGRK